MSVASGCYKPSKNGSKGKKQASAGKCQGLQATFGQIAGNERMSNLQRLLHSTA